MSKEEESAAGVAYAPCSFPKPDERCASYYGAANQQESDCQQFESRLLSYSRIEDWKVTAERAAWSTTRPVKQLLHTPLSGCQVGSPGERMGRSAAFSQFRDTLHGHVLHENRV